MAFELRSPDHDILEEARRVFDPWHPSENAELVESYEAHWTDDQIVVSPRPSPPDGTEAPRIPDAAHAVGVVEYAAIWQIVESCNHLLCFHAALLSRNGKGVAIVGQSHAGKSTLAAGLWQSGWDFLCDDLTIVVGRKAFPAPRRVSLRDESRALLGDTLWNSIRETQSYFRHEPACLFQPMHIDGARPRGVDLSALIFLKRSGAVPAATQPQRLNAADATLSLLPYTNLIRNVPFEAALKPVAELMAETPAWDLPRAPLAEMITMVDRLVSEDT